MLYPHCPRNNLCMIHTCKIDLHVWCSYPSTNTEVHFVTSLCKISYLTLSLYSSTKLTVRSHRPDYQELQPSIHCVWLNVLLLECLLKDMSICWVYSLVILLFCLYYFKSKLLVEINSSFVAYLYMPGKKKELLTKNWQNLPNAIHYNM